MDKVASDYYEAYQSIVNKSTVSWFLGTKSFQTSQDFQSRYLNTTLLYYY
jgi:hypothetical protein